MSQPSPKCSRVKPFEGQAVLNRLRKPSIPSKAIPNRIAVKPTSGTDATPEPIQPLPAAVRTRILHMCRGEPCTIAAMRRADLVKDPGEDRLGGESRHDSP